MARPVKVCIDTNVLLGFFNEEPGKVESCALFLQLLFTRRIPAIIPVITLLELAAILTAADRYPQAERIITAIESLPHLTIAEFRTQWILHTARLKKANRLAMADAIIVATAIETSCSHLITSDADFRHIPDIAILTPLEFLELFAA
jgi:predicted nucleic acid-binding protein